MMTINHSAFSPDLPLELTEKEWLLVDAKVRQIIRRCLEIDPQDRFADAGELLQALPPVKEVNLSSLVASVTKKQAQINQIGEVETSEIKELPKKSFGSLIEKENINVNNITIEHVSAASQDPILRIPDVIISRRLGSDEHGKYCVLEQNARLRIGRELKNDLIIIDERVSRYQALIYWKDQQYIIEDTNSYKQTRLNGKPLKQPTPLADGDQIGIGTYTLTFWAQRLVPPTSVNTTAADIAEN